MALLSAVALVPSLAAPRVVAQDQPPTLPAMQVVVLVDESGSIQDADLVREKEAARTIAFSPWGTGTVLSVVGFASAERAGQSAVDVVCPPAKISEAQQRDVVANCIGGLRKRADGEGDGTDHAAALQQALAHVGAGGPEKKIVFLLTDGKLDVSGSPSWGSDPDRRNAAAAANVREVLASLDKAGAQVWPLGFGEVDVAALGGFAKGRSCTPAAPDPRERVVPTSAELRTAIFDALSSASCIKILPPETGDVPKGGSLELTVDIPAVASDASIVVFKRDPRVQVEYRARNAARPAPGGGGAKFEFAGQTTETESLRITDPEPGQWVVRLSSAEVAAQDVAATVMYQAAVKAVLTTNPPQPAPGQTVEVDMQVWARGKAVTDPPTLQGLTFVTTLTGTSGFAPQQVTLNDSDGDGTYAGQLKVPDNASGDLTYTGEVTGIGIGGDTRTLFARVSKGAAAVQGQILFDDNRSTVTPGGTVTGTVAITNNSGKDADLRLRLDDLSPGTAVTVDPAAVRVGTGTGTAKFTLRFGPDSALGVSGGKLRLVDEKDAVVAERLFATEVAPEPGLPEKLWWLWTLLGVLLLAALVWLLLKLRSRAESRKVRGLTAQLWQGGFLTSELSPRDARAKVFRFVVVEEFTGLKLQQAGPGETNVYEVRRVRDGVSLTAPGQPPVVLTAGQRKEIGKDLAVGVADERGTAGAAVSGPPGDPFAAPAASTVDAAHGFGAPDVSMQPPPDPFGGSYDPFGGSAPAPAGTNGANGSHPDPFGGGGNRPDPFGGGSHSDPFGGGGQPDPFGGGGQSGGPSTRRGGQPDPFADPYNPF
ncbi:VWA domain-containing protein [Nocardia sp. NRRL S-836]|uniref:VWA domain-containing protein n=1 Tax=Nocardia sp. NRRL S-836 TaxID=1519492 RepID=UPI0006C467A7|nr:VWA domain-containing protein [Nocardia sp. NRRL S-836]KOV87188.1 hypothetical protein ADL03_07425 [Nocardia sp. NRRL S-836]